MRVVNIAQFATTACNGNYGPGVLAVTYAQWDTVTKEMLAADISFNNRYIWGIYDGPIFPPPHYTTRPDFQRVAVHELGHAAGLNHSASRSDIMFAAISDVDRPSASDKQALQAKYSGPPPSPVPPGEFTCNSTRPYQPTVELGTLTQTLFRLGECLDGSRPNQIFNFQLASPRRINLSLAADTAEINVEVIGVDGTGYWQSVNTRDRTKSKIVDFPAGRFWMRLWYAPTGSSYRVGWEFVR